MPDLSAGLQCPKCHSDKNVRKVSAIVEQEMDTGSQASANAIPVPNQGPGPGKSAIGGMSNQPQQQNASNQGVASDEAALARRLSFPKHIYPLGRFLRVTGILALLGLIASVVLYFIIGGGNFFAMLGQEKFLYAVLATAIFLVLFILIGLYRFSKRGEHKALRERAYADWLQLYYCYHDDIVFVIGEDRQHVHSRHMRRLLGY